MSVYFTLYVNCMYAWVSSNVPIWGTGSPAASHQTKVALYILNQPSAVFSRSVQDKIMPAAQIVNSTVWQLHSGPKDNVASEAEFSHFPFQYWEEMQSQAAANWERQFSCLMFGGSSEPRESTPQLQLDTEDLSKNVTLTLALGRSVLGTLTFWFRRIGAWNLSISKGKTIIRVFVVKCTSHGLQFICMKNADMKHNLLIVGVTYL